ncbi:hypothetical protein TRFO_09395 [Tritrichomonas foetus]|uniref:Uncharacterized protein n=1 Tax=Tritrichomonas foetus TaxID=1144522 RepID=A0A1J4JFH4_9EUKA|nr:hypothetical protein TRFO_09395 [Tritrichomonas foetus]|eukprot:OHS97417.1 hypothetical protein TRFO_09395 [Tritrichomonas foetus]
MIGLKRILQRLIEFSFFLCKPYFDLNDDLFMKLFYFFLFSTFSKLSSVCGNVIGDYDVSSYGASTFNMIDAVFHSVFLFHSEVFDTAFANEYAPYGLILLVGSVYNLNPSIDLSTYDINFEWVQIMYDKVRLTLTTPPAVTLKIRDGQVKNLSIIDTTVTIVDKVNVQTLELSHETVITNPENIACDHYSLYFSKSVIFEFMGLKLYGDFSCQDTTMNISLGKKIISVSSLNSGGVSIDSVTVNIPSIEFNWMTVDIPSSIERCSFEITPNDGVEELTRVEFEFEELSSIPNVYGDVVFAGWQDINFKSQSKPTISFLDDTLMNIINPPDSVLVQQYQRNGYSIIYQSIITIEEAYICYNYCQLGVKSTHERLLVYVNDEDEIKHWISSIDNTITDNVYIYSPVPIGANNSLSLIGIPKLTNLYIEGDLYKAEDGTIDYSSWSVDVDDSVTVENLIIAKCVFNANGLSKMQVNSLSMQDNGIIKGRINVQNAYVNFNEFTRSFDSITLEKLNLRINLTSNGELTYDTRGWEFTTSDGKSDIIVLSSSTAVANSVYFHIYTNGTFTILLTLRRSDIKSIKGLEFTVYPGLSRSNFLLSEPELEMPLNTLLSSKSNENSNLLEKDLLMEHGIHRNWKWHQLTDIYQVDFLFNTDSWVDNRIGECSMIFISQKMSYVTVNEATVPDNFIITILSSQGNVDPSNDKNITETNSTETLEYEEKNLRINLIIGIVIPAIVIFCGIIIFVVMHVMKSKKDSNEENSQLIPDEQHEETDQAKNT